MKRLDDVVVLVGYAVRRGWRVNANIKDGEPVISGRDCFVGSIRLARNAPLATASERGVAYTRSGKHRLWGT
jgi:hypothetical protein